MLVERMLAKILPLLKRSGCFCPFFRSQSGNDSFQATDCGGSHLPKVKLVESTSQALKPDRTLYKWEPLYTYHQQLLAN